MPINACTFVGNLTRDPELKALSTGTQVCEFSIAVNERIKQNGEWADYANYLDIVVYGGSAENCAKFLAKGRQVAVAARAKHERWQNAQGENRSRVRFVAQDVQFIGAREEMTGQQARQAAQNGGVLPQAGQSYPVEQSDFGSQGASGFGAPPAAQTGPFSDNDVPF